MALFRCGSVDYKVAGFYGLQTFDLGEVKTLTSIRTIGGFGGYAYTEYQVSTDGTNWTRVYRLIGSSDVPDNEFLREGSRTTPINARYVRATGGSHKRSITIFTW